MLTSVRSIRDIIEGQRRHVYINLSDPSAMQELLTSTKVQAEYRHMNGEISKVRIEALVLGMRKVRIANLPPEILDRNLRTALGKFGEYETYKEKSGLVSTVTLWPTALGRQC